MVFFELVTACRFAASPTKRSPVFVKATTEGVTRRPSEFSSTTGSPPSITAIHELVVPKSIPITFAIKFLLLVRRYNHFQAPAMPWFDLFSLVFSNKQLIYLPA